MPHCGRKVRYPSVGSAKAAMARLRAAGKLIGPARVYRCKTCGSWHWGHAPGGGWGKAQQVISAVDRAMARDAERRRKAVGREGGDEP